MKKIVSLILGTFLLFSCSSNGNKQTTDVGEMVSYGPEKVDTTKAISSRELVTMMENEKGEKEVTFYADIKEVCSKAGCWINIDKGNGETFMVRFKDHFTIPPKTKVGTKAFLSGVAYWDTVTVDLLRHFAEDAGKSKEDIEKITEPKYELAFEADGITFIKPKK